MGMALTALARRGPACDPGLADALAAAIARVLPELTGAEVAMSIHSGARLSLDLTAAIPELVAGDGQYSFSGLEDCDLPHLALLLHGLAKARIKAPEAVWQLLAAQHA